jgi:MFS family permease
VLAAGTLATAWPPALAVLWVPGPAEGGSFWLPLALAAVVGLLAPVPKPLTTLLLLETNAAAVRGTALAGHRLAAHTGQALGPMAAGGLAVLWGRPVALGILLSGWFVAAILLLVVAALVRREPRSLHGRKALQ